MNLWTVPLGVGSGQLSACRQMPTPPPSPRTVQHRGVRPCDGLAKAEFHVDCVGNPADGLAEADFRHDGLSNEQSIGDDIDDSVTGPSADAGPQSEIESVPPLGKRTGRKSKKRSS